MGITTLFGAVLALAGCGGSLTCGEGTIEVDGECVAADTDGSGDDGSGDDGSTDSGTSSDDSGSAGDAGGTDSGSGDSGGTDSGGGDTVAPQSALLLIAVGDADCDASISVTIDAPESAAGLQWAEGDGTNQAFLFDDGDVVVVSASTVHACADSYYGNTGTWVMDLDGYLLFVAMPGLDFTGWQEAGVDYDPDTVRVVFEDGIGTSYAESLIADTPASIRTTVGEDPPQYLLQPEGGATAPQVAAELLVLPDVSWAMPEPL